jgi:ribosomal protein S12 methylthiotransferase accessory factor
MEMEVNFPGGLAVDATFGNFTISTDQPRMAGGDGSAPSPFALFIGSIATCAGFFALRFCQERALDTEGMKLSCKVNRNPETRRLEDVAIDLKLPEGFPDKYTKPIIRAIDQCAVKRTIQDPPEFSVTTS